MAFGSLGNCVKCCRSWVHVALSTSSSNVNLEARIPTNPEADCENNNKLRGCCLKRGPHQLGFTYKLQADQRCSRRGFH